MDLIELCGADKYEPQVVQAKCQALLNLKWEGNQFKSYTFYNIFFIRGNSLVCTGIGRQRREYKIME